MRRWYTMSDRGSVTGSRTKQRSRDAGMALRAERDEEVSASDAVGSQVPDRESQMKMIYQLVWDTLLKMGVSVEELW